MTRDEAATAVMTLLTGDPVCNGRVTTETLERLVELVLGSSQERNAPESEEGPSFAAHPVSLAEVKAERAVDASVWKPRDALVHCLRLIDRGEFSPSAVVLVFDTEETATADYYQATPSKMYHLGMLARATAFYSHL